MLWAAHKANPRIVLWTMLCLLMMDVDNPQASPVDKGMCRKEITCAVCFLLKSLVMKQNKANVIIPDALSGLLEEHEIEAAWIAARYFNAKAEFLIPIDGYKVKTADLVIEGRIWELKSPSGKSKTTVGNQFKRATRQSKFIIFDGRNIHIPDDDVAKRIKHELSKRRSIRRLFFINAEGTMLEILR